MNDKLAGSIYLDSDPENENDDHLYRDHLKSSNTCKNCFFF